MIESTPNSPVHTQTAQSQLHGDLCNCTAPRRTRTLPLLNLCALLLAIAVAMLVPHTLPAQVNSTGTIHGTVTDSTGAAVPNATVTVLNEGNGATASVKSASDGSFVVNALQPADYTVEVLVAGFKGYKVTGLTVHPAVTANVVAALSIGEQTTQITVSAAPAQVETTTPEISSELSSAQIATLPMNGRNYQTLAALMPGAVNLSAGVAMGQGGFNTSNVMSANGMGTAGTFYTLDGIWNENSGNFTQQSVTPTPDMIQEVRILQNNYSAEYNYVGASVAIVQTRSGESRFHGSAYEFFRNDALNTRNYFSKSVPLLRQNIYGYTVGGPAFIPAIYNRSRKKTFFFVSEQWSPVHKGSVLSGTTATAAQRSGNFSALATPITDPTTRMPFPGNVIPQARLSQPALALINALAPLPNNVAAGALNYLNTDAEIDSQRNDFAKIDHNFSERQRLTAEYVAEHANTLLSYNAGNGSPFNTNKESQNWNDYLTQIRLASTITANMLNQAAIAMNHRVVSLTQQGLTELSQLPTYTQSVPYSGGIGTDRLPAITFSGGYSPFGAASGLPLVRNSNLDLFLADDWSYVRGKHYLQIGAVYYYGSKRQTNANASNGAWSFTGASTGNALADYLLGYSASLTQFTTETRPYAKFTMVSPYVEDTWKVTPRLTISGGLRYLYAPMAHVDAGTETVFEPYAYVASQAPVVSTSGIVTPTANYNPLNGLVYNGKNGVPLNISNAHNNYFAPTLGFALDLYGNGRTSLRGGFGTARTHTPTAFECVLTCGTNPPAVNSITLTNPNFPNAVGAAAKPTGVATLAGQDPDLQDSAIQSYSLSLEQQFGQDWFASVAYAANSVRHLPVTLNLNTPLSANGLDFNPTLNAGTVNEYYYAPYQGYAAINTKSSFGSANWNALELSLRHPAGHHVAFSISYTYQHDLSTVQGTGLFDGGNTAQNPYNLHANYGNASVNIPQVFASSVIWTLPALQRRGRFVRNLLGGWQYSDITTVQAGASLSAGISTSSKGLATRPNYAGGSVGGPKTVQQWFNRSAFVAPPVGLYGNAAPGTIAGPGAIVFDMALYKTFPLWQEHALEFRSELFNIFNHTNFQGVSTALGAVTYGQVTTARDPRIAEFALRYRF